jgi:hypothetical protein
MSSFVHSTAPPAVTSTEAGENRTSRIETRTTGAAGAVVAAAFGFGIPEQPTRHAMRRSSEAMQIGTLHDLQWVAGVVPS